MLLLGAIIGIGGLFLSSFSTTLLTFLLLYPICYGIGIGICFFVPLMCGWEFYPEKKGTLSGIMLGSFGISSFFYGFICMAIVNPDNAEPIE